MTTIEQGLQDLTAEFGLTRIDISCTTHRSPALRFGTMLYLTGGLGSGEGATIDEAVTVALRSVRLLD